MAYLQIPGFNTNDPVGSTKAPSNPVFNAGTTQIKVNPGGNIAIRNVSEPTISPDDRIVQSTKYIPGPGAVPSEVYRPSTAPMTLPHEGLFGSAVAQHVGQGTVGQAAGYLGATSGLFDQPLSPKAPTVSPIYSGPAASIPSISGAHPDYFMQGPEFRPPPMAKGPSISPPYQESEPSGPNYSAVDKGNASGIRTFDKVKQAQKDFDDFFKADPNNPWGPTAPIGKSAKLGQGTVTITGPGVATYTGPGGTHELRQGTDFATYAGKIPGLEQHWESQYGFDLTPEQLVYGAQNPLGQGSTQADARWAYLQQDNPGSHFYHHGASPAEIQKNVERGVPYLTPQGTPDPAYKPGTPEWDARLDAILRGEFQKPLFGPGINKPYPDTWAPPPQGYDQPRPVTQGGRGYGPIKPNMAVTEAPGMFYNPDDGTWEYGAQPAPTRYYDPDTDTWVTGTPPPGYAHPTETQGGYGGVPGDQSLTTTPGTRGMFTGPENPSIPRPENYQPPQAYGYNVVTGSAEEYEPYTREVQQRELVAQQLDAALQSPYAELARRRALDEMASRGIVNSTMATKAAEQAALEAALPIAMQDAQTEAQAALLNQEAINRAREFGARESNAMTALNMGAINQAARDFAEWSTQISLDSAKLQLTAYLDELRANISQMGTQVSRDNYITGALSTLIQAGMTNGIFQTQETALEYLATIAEVFPEFNMTIGEAISDDGASDVE